MKAKIYILTACMSFLFLASICPAMAQKFKGLSFGASGGYSLQRGSKDMFAGDTYIQANFQLYKLRFDVKTTLAYMPVDLHFYNMYYGLSSDHLDLFFETEIYPFRGKAKNLFFGFGLGVAIFNRLRNSAANKLKADKIDIINENPRVRSSVGLNLPINKQLNLKLYAIIGPYQYRIVAENLYVDSYLMEGKYETADNNIYLQLGASLCINIFKR
jgi:hypothetical protein